MVIDFWASWCGPCVQGLPIMQKVCSSFDQEKVKFVAVNQGENKKTINKFLKNKNLTEQLIWAWIHFPDLDGGWIIHDPATKHEERSVF